jgi:hypothetical protein
VVGITEIWAKFPGTVYHGINPTYSSIPNLPKARIVICNPFVGLVLIGLTTTPKVKVICFFVSGK